MNLILSYNERESNFWKIFKNFDKQNLFYTMPALLEEKTLPKVVFSPL